ncbi:MAG: DUF4339 domain-containing protein [Rhodopirellula sp.]|nr:DUF4339 domain-containing protein [Rhodopirellula sp.]
MLRRSTKTKGPFTQPQLIKLAKQGKISAESNVRKGATGKWHTAGKIRGLQSYLHESENSNESPTDSPEAAYLQAQKDNPVQEAALPEQQSQPDMSQLWEDDESVQDARLPEQRPQTDMLQVWEDDEPVQDARVPAAIRTATAVPAVQRLNKLKLDYVTPEKQVSGELRQPAAALKIPARRKDRTASEKYLAACPDTHSDLVFVGEMLYSGFS